MKSNFVIADEHGRELFKHYCSTQNWCKVVKESKDDYAPWDISYYSGSTMIIGEIKVRQYTNDAFGDWDYEEKKHLALKEVLASTKEKYPENAVEIQYINIFKDENVKIWTTTNIDQLQVPQVKYRPATTFGRQTMVEKRIFNCNPSIEVNKGNLNQPLYTLVKLDKDDEYNF